jgi:hypothetical protein
MICDAWVAMVSSARCNQDQAPGASGAPRALDAIDGVTSDPTRGLLAIINANKR